MLPKPDQRIITRCFSVRRCRHLGESWQWSCADGFHAPKGRDGADRPTIIDDTVGWVIVPITSASRFTDRWTRSPWVRASRKSNLSAASLPGQRLYSASSADQRQFCQRIALVTAILVIMCTMALTHLIGVHTVLGAFVAGILIGESPILTRHIDEQLRGLVVALFMPIFFSLAGLHADLTILRDSTLFFLTIGLILIASLGKFAGAFVGGALGGLSARESLALGCGMNARGSTE
jgi:Kef-type K+ transport system membrane component KefB